MRPMAIAWYTWRAGWRRSWRAALTIAVIGGLLGAVALGALAGARRTDSAYGRYLNSVNASDVMVDVPGPLLPVIEHIEHLPGVTSAAAWLGLNATPIFNGKPDDSFQIDSVAGSLDGEYLRQDRVTVLSGHLPPPGATDEVVLTPELAQDFGVGVGGHVTWQFSRQPFKNGLPTDAPPVNAGPQTFTVAAIATAPPVLGDEFDDTESALLPPVETARFLNGEFSFGWVGMRLSDGAAGIPALQQELASYGAELSKQYQFPVSFLVRRLDVVHDEAQQAIQPQAFALAALGGLALLAMLVLVGQGLAQLLSTSAADSLAFRELGMSRGQAALAAGGSGGAAVIAATAIAAAGAVALSSLAPIGEVREYDPARGVQVDGLVIGGGSALLLLLLGGLLSWLAWRSGRRAGEPLPTRSAAVAAVASQLGLPVTVTTGVRHALERGTGRLRAPVRTSLAGSAAAVAALAAALVFSASLSGLVAHPQQYGWNWTVLIQSQGGWGNWPEAAMARLVNGQPGVTGWSEFGFSQVPMASAAEPSGAVGPVIPVLGLEQHSGSAVEPPTTSGHPLAGEYQVELGTVTMRQLGLHLGEQVRIAPDPHPFTVVGTVTLPSMGTVLTDHVSLGRGAMMEESALEAVQELATRQPAADDANNDNASDPADTSAVAVDVSSAADAQRLAARIIKAEPDETPGGMYQLPPQRGAQIINFQQMGDLPLTLALGVAAAALVALALTVLASVRQRRREFAVLKSLGMRRGQLRTVVASQAAAILTLAAVVGAPLGVALGRWTWITFANAIGVVPTPAVPVTELAVGVAGLIAAGVLLALWPAAIAARTSAAVVLRSE
jgi:ABC-type lipoprotein release transport system permease subunit